MKRYWPHLLLVVAVFAWFMQQGLDNNDASQAQHTKSKAHELTDGNTAVVNIEQNKTVTTKSKLPPSDTESDLLKTSTAQGPEHVTLVTEQLVQRMASESRVNYQTIAGFKPLQPILAQKCGNRLDSNIEQGLFQALQYSGSGIFISEHFCLASIAWNKLQKVPTDISKGREKFELDQLQQQYTQLMAQLTTKSEQILVTRLFVNTLVQFYHAFPVIEHYQHEYYQIGVMIKFPFKFNPKRYFVRTVRFNLLNQFNIPQYLFEDTLNNTLEQQAKRIEQRYKPQVMAIFEQQQRLFAQIN